MQVSAVGGEIKGRDRGRGMGMAVATREILPGPPSSREQHGIFPFDGQAGYRGRMRKRSNQ